MNKKRTLITVSALAIIGGIAYWQWQQHSNTEVATDSPAPTETEPKIRKPQAPPSDENAPEPSVTDTDNPLFGLNAPDSTIEKDLRIVESLFFHYYSTFKSVPLGTHEEIVASFLGNNRHKIQYLQPDNPALNEKQQLVDRWGTPFFFHAISSQEMEIISAGPDKQIWSEDDHRYQATTTPVSPLAKK